MKDLILSPITIPELVTLIADEIESRISRQEASESLPDRIDLNEVMNITGLKKSAIYKLTMAGTIPHGKYGRLLVFSRTEILNWIDQQIVRKQSKDQAVLGNLRNSSKKHLK
ncbi:MAG: helix-turn-helix domain-containing protein [Bacteroidales bacterium]|jgi:predicted DNA-binding transcriptional regulator AlpA|nr:helix-turn-helix domain-containing protein [Bacteroidales bacterium]